MPVWIEAILGLAAVALCAVASWREDALVAWEDRVVSANKIKRNFNPRTRMGCDRSE